MFVIICCGLLLATSELVSGWITDRYLNPNTEPNSISWLQRLFTAILVAIGAVVYFVLPVGNTSSSIFGIQNFFSLIVIGALIGTGYEAISNKRRTTFRVLKSGFGVVIKTMLISAVIRKMTLCVFLMVALFLVIAFGILLSPPT